MNTIHDLRIFIQNFYIKNLKNNFKALTISYSLSILLYLPNITSLLPNPDAIWNSNMYKTGYDWEVYCGRPMLKILAKINGFTISPSFFAIIGLFFCCLTGLLIADLLDIKHNISKILCSILLVLSIAVQGTITGYYYFPFYMLAMFLAVLALSIAFYINTTANITTKIVAIIIAGLILCISLTTYQAYLGLAIPLGIILIIKNIFNESNTHITKMHISMFSTLIIGILSYSIITKLAISSSEGRFTSFTFNGIFSRISNCYLYFYSYYLGNGFLNNDYSIFMKRRTINLIFFIILFIICTMLIYKNKYRFKQIILATLYLLIFPISLFIISLVSGDSILFGTTGAIMLPGFTLIYIVLIALIDNMPIKWLKYVSYISLATIIIMLTSLLIDGQTFLKYRMNKTDEVARLIVTQASPYIYNGEADDIMIVGQMENGNYPDCYPNLNESIKWTTPSYGTIWSDFTGSNACWNMYINEIIGTNLSIHWNNTIDEKEIEDMTYFPSKGSIKLINNTVVIKLSDW